MPFSPAYLKQQLTSVVRPRGWWVALSGGLDSTLLLYSMAALKLPEPLSALHINHQLSPHADAWEQQCAQLCENLGVPFHSERVEVEATGRGLEDAAREARYRVFSDYLGEGEVLLTGHHADDQVETLLLRLMRGSGPRGLAAMAAQRALGRGTLMRPLLALGRVELHDYAMGQGLTWIEDESNAELHFDRNYLRAQVVPILAQRWPGFHSRWQQSAELCAESDQLLEELAQLDLMAAQPRPEWAGWSLDLSVAQSMSRARRHNLLRYWLRRMGLTLPGRTQWAEVDSQLLEGREDSQPQVRWDQWALRRFQQRLYLLHLPELPKPVGGCTPVALSIAPDSEVEVTFPGGGALLFSLQSSSDSPLLRADLPDLQLRWRCGGERCRPGGRAHSQSLKKLLQEAELAPWWRTHVPLIYSGDQLAAVGDLWICEGFSARPNQAGYRLRWNRAGKGERIQTGKF